MTEETKALLAGDLEQMTALAQQMLDALTVAMATLEEVRIP